MALTKKGYIKRLIDDASNNLLQFSNKYTTKPAFLCVICGMIDYAYRRKDGVYVVSITALKS